MAKKKVADLLLETLAGAGVERIYGVSGDSLNGITDAIRRREQLRWIHVRHEETAAFAAGAEAHLTGRFEHDGPALVEAIVSRHELSMPPTITLEQMKGFSLFMLKAVLSGRGDEIIDLAKTNLFR